MRTTRSQSLSDDGQAFYDHCLRALAEIRAGKALIDSGRQAAVGRLRVSMPVLFGRRCVAPILTRFAQRHPKLELDLNFTDRLVDLIEDGIDLAIRNAPLPDTALLTARRIAEQRMAVCAAPGYLAAHGTPQRIEDLAQHEAVNYASAGRVADWLFPRDGGAPLAFTPKGRLRFDDLEAMAEAATAGYGITWLPCWLIRDRVRSGELVTVLGSHTGLPLESFAVWPQTPHLPLRVRLAIDALATELQDTVEI